MCHRPRPACSRAGAAQRLGRAGATRRLDDLERAGEVHAPTGIDRERAPAPAGTEPGADDVFLEQQRRVRGPVLRGPLPVGEQRPVRDADRGHPEHRAEVEREAGAARMVACGRVHEQHVREAGQPPHGGLEQRALAQCQQGGLVGRRGTAGVHHDVVVQRRRRPGRVAARARAAQPARKAHEAAADAGGARRPQARRVSGGESFLFRDQGGTVCGPIRHIIKWLVCIGVDAFLAIASRREVRSYADRPLPADVQRRVLEAGRVSGSSANRQQWRFVVAESDNVKRRLSETVYTPSNITGAPFVVAVVIYGKGPGSFDAGRTAQNMMLAAWNEGVGSCPNAMPDRAAAAGVLGLAEGEEPVIVLSFGYPSKPRDPDRRSAEDWAAAANRKSFDEVVSRI